jgi:hypothetical protein
LVSGCNGWTGAFFSYKVGPLSPKTFKTVSKTCFINTLTYNRLHGRIGRTLAHGRYNLRSFISHHQRQSSRSLVFLQGHVGKMHQNVIARLVASKSINTTPAKISTVPSCNLLWNIVDAWGVQVRECGNNRAIHRCCHFALKYQLI